MKMIAGLGNPGREYEGTPHNVGFDVVDALASRLGASWKNSSKFHALTAKAEYAGDVLWLVKPQTYMNLSGQAVAPLLRYYAGTPADLVAVEDDADLPLGRLRIRAGGGSGGHHGLDSLIACLGTEAFARIRIGIGRRGHGDLAAQVLGKFGADRLELAGKAVAAAADAALCLAEKGLNEAMNRFNGWDAQPPAETPVPDKGL
ncbi:MAG: aminoacyl-tRNA hydrolase [Kiritimatiellae bacterium]|nr:aminoacyl-tRNA hydrolase [Kiritimatiellia bacterium]